MFVSSGKNYPTFETKRFSNPLLKGAMTMTTESESAVVKNQEGGRSERRRPDHEISRFDGGVLRVGIWVTEHEADGRVAFSVTPSCRFRDKGGNWQTTRSFTGQQLLSLSKLFQEADSWCEEYRAKYYARRRERADEPF
jgi:hypothetical protein